MTGTTKQQGGPSGPGVLRGLRGPLLGLALVVALGVLAVVYGAGKGDGSDRAGGSVAEVERPEGAAASDPLASLARRVPDDPMAQGEVDAPVVMIMWSDFQCPFCGKFARETEPELVERYVRDGTLRLEWRDFPYLGSESQVGAQAGRAAAAQDKFWEFQAAVYATEPTPGNGKVTAERLTSIAADLGLDVARFERDMQSEETLAAIRTDFTEGQSLGISGTPAFVVNSTPVVGAQPLDVFRSIIDEAAAAADE